VGSSTFLFQLEAIPRDGETVKRVIDVTGSKESASYGDCCGIRWNIRILYGSIELQESRGKIGFSSTVAGSLGPLR
jgi:hypothetical protein